MRLARRIGIAIGGGLLILVGAILSLPGIPGPGFAVILMGLGVLSLEFERPRIWLAAIRSRFRAFMDWLRRRSERPRIWLAVLARPFKALTNRIRRKSPPGDGS
jgi:hypothetical protein